VKARTAAARTVAAILLSLAGIVRAEDPSKLAERARILESEAALAKNPVSYMVIDLPARKILLKARGFVLRSWDIWSDRLWGKPVDLKGLKLVGKTAISKPERKNITPGKEDPKNAKPKKPSTEPDVLELKDMPIHYSLIFGDNIRVSVKPKTPRFWASVVNVARDVSWFAYLPLKTLWLSLKHKAFTEIEIVMPTENDAKSLYWAFIEGLNAIIIDSST
jgi:hypothetical protein